MILLLLIRYKLIEIRRQIVDNLFTLIGLGPMILVVLYLLAVPYLRALALGVYPMPSARTAFIIITTLILLFLLTPASAVAEQFYPLQSPDSYLDSLPITINTRFSALAIMRILSNLPLFLVLIGLHYFITTSADRPPQLLWLLLTVICPALLELAALQILLVLLAAHFGFLRITRMLPSLGIIFGLALLFPALSSTLLLPITNLQALWTNLLLGWFDPAIVPTKGSAIIGVLLALGYFLAGYVAYLRWGVDDREAVERALGMRRQARGVLRVTNLIERLTNSKVAAHLYRDLILTFRFFSSAVYLSFAMAVLCEIGLIVFGLRYTRIGEEFEVAAQAACALASFALAALTPALVKHQLPFLWIERSLAVEGGDMYLDKLWYARLVSLPAVIISIILTLAFGSLDFNTTAFLLLKLILIWVMVASFVGALSFEIAARPSLAIPFTAIASLAAASLVIRVWWLWLLLYPFSMDKLELRAHDRTRILLTGLEGDND